MLRHVFKAMGTSVEALLEPTRPGGAQALLDVESEFERLEGIMSRFRPDSALSRLNEAGWVQEPELARVIELAIEARLSTSGRFDATIHDALVAAGYDRTFEELEDTGPPGAPCPAGGGVRVTGDEVELDAGVRLDLGGIGKGFAVDRAVELLAPYGPCLVNAGGDLAVAGVPSEGVWAVAVGTQSDPLTVGLTLGALATSGRDRRRWTRGGKEVHHLIDPATGQPAHSRWWRVTVAAQNAVAAEVTAKDVFLGADPTGLDAVLVAPDGSVTRTGALA